MGPCPAEDLGPPVVIGTPSPALPRSAAVEVDAAVVRALHDNAPGRLIDLDEQQAEDAAIDGLWQTLILAGVMQHTPMRGEVLSYEVPPAYATGLIVATFAPASEMG